LDISIEETSRDVFQNFNLLAEQIPLKQILIKLLITNQTQHILKHCKDSCFYLLKCRTFVIELFLITSKAT